MQFFSPDKQPVFDRAVSFTKYTKAAIFLLIRTMITMAAVILLFGCSHDSFPEPEETIAAYVRLWQEADYSEMYGLLTAESRLLHTEETFTARHSNISSGISLTELSLTNYQEEALEDGTVKAGYTLTFTTNIVPPFTKDYTTMLHKGEEVWLMEWDHNLIFPELTEDLVVRVSRHFPMRGSVLDRNGDALASPGNAREVGVVPGRIADEKELLKSLAPLLQVSEEFIYNAYTQSWVQEDMFVPLKKITEGFWQDNRDNLLAIQGVLVNTTSSRNYTVPSSLSQTLGYISEISANELQARRPEGYRAGDMTGSTGLERAFEAELSGEIGFTISIDDQQRQNVATISEKTSRDGSDLKTTIDTGLQKVADAAMGKHSGSAVILDHMTGEILALASKPGFDPNLFALSITSQQYAALQELDSPFLNRALNGLYPPGSTFKPFTALIALYEEAFSPDYSWDTPLQWQKEPGWGHYHITRVSRPPGPVDLTKAMKFSDNVYFADLALKTGWGNFTKHEEHLGFGLKIPLVLNVSSSQLTSTGTGDILLADTGYGQGEMLLNPLHLALMYTLIARTDGSIPRPTLLPRDTYSPWLQTPYKPETIELLDDILGTTARDQDGLAIRIPGKDVRGKTGTAEISAEKQLGWFACYFDTYTLVVLLEGDRTMTSRNAINVARKIIEEDF